MGFLGFSRKKQEIRAETSEKQGTMLTLDDVFTSRDSLSRDEAMQIPTVSAAVNKIAETVARLPVHLYKRTDGKVVEITDDSRIRLLNGETGDTLSTVDMWKAVISDYYLGAGAWIYLNYSGIRLKSMHYIDSTYIGINCNTDPIFKDFNVLINGNIYMPFRFIKLLRRTKNGWDNIPLQSDNASILLAAYNSLKLEKQMAANGGCKPGFLKSKNKITAEVMSKIKEGFSKIFGNDDQKQRVVVLNEGMEFQPVTSTSAELQMNENKKTNSVEICKLFGFPHTVLDGSATKQDEKEFISVVIALVNQIETELDNVMLLEDEKESGYYWAFDAKELTRGDLLERWQAYEIAKRNNILQTDEIRLQEDYEPTGFNWINLSLGDVLLDPESMRIYTPNTGTMQNLKEQEVKKTVEN